MGSLLFWAYVAIVVGVAVSEDNDTFPVLDADEWWGPMELKDNQDTSIRSFEINFQDSMIDDLRSRLRKHINWTPPLEDAEDFTRGFNTDRLYDWLSYWAENYNFSERKAFFNQFPHYKTNIQGLDIHFIRVTPEVSDGVTTVPLLLLHGWPGSVREFYEVIPLLTNQTSGYDFVFEVIVPSLPGFGFSDPAVRTGLGAPRVAVIMFNLMKRLGFEKFYVQGGDWGAVIASAITTLYPDYVLGHHTNKFTVRNSCGILSSVGANLSAIMTDSQWAYMIEECAYFHMQYTKPDSLGVALSDSPAGLLAYVLEKFSTWTNSNYTSLEDGGLEERFTKDQLIDNLMLYWSTNSITTSMRLYAETMSTKNTALNLDSYPSSVPTCIIQAKYDLFYQTTESIKTKFTNLLRNKALDDGGHFLAFELPDIFAEDVFSSIQEIMEWRKNNA